jgi:hypothetical protein
MFKKAKLNYDFSIFLDSSYEIQSSCITHQVHELTDIHKKFGGFPKTYSLENTTIYQLWWDRQTIDFKNIGDQLGIEVVTVSSIMQPPGNVIPWHRDTFYQINKAYPERNEKKVRANIFLEDYKIGHFIQYQDGEDITTVTNWSKGDALIWDSDILHLGANAGMEHKYTLQISGFLM